MSIDINTVTTTSFRNLIEEKFLNWAMSKSLSYRILYVIYIKALFHNNFLANIGKAKKGYEIDILCGKLKVINIGKVLDTMGFPRNFREILDL